MQKASTVISKKVYDIIQNSRMHIINQTGIPEWSCRRIVGDFITITNRTPIMIDGQVKGALAILKIFHHWKKLLGNYTKFKN